MLYSSHRKQSNSHSHFSRYLYEEAADRAVAKVSAWSDKPTDAECRRTHRHTMEMLLKYGSAQYRRGDANHYPRSACACRATRASNAQA